MSFEFPPLATVPGFVLSTVKDSIVNNSMSRKDIWPLASNSIKGTIILAAIVFIPHIASMLYIGSRNYQKIYPKGELPEINDEEMKKWVAPCRKIVIIGLTINILAFYLMRRCCTFHSFSTNKVIDFALPYLFYHAASYTYERCCGKESRLLNYIREVSSIATWGSIYGCSNQLLALFMYMVPQIPLPGRPTVVFSVTERLLKLRRKFQEEEKAAAQKAEEEKKAASTKTE